MTCCSVVQIKSKGEKKKDKFFTMDPQQISFDMVRQKLKELVMTRGKRGVDRNEQVEMLTYLGTVSKGPVQKIEVLIQVVSALFDINPSMSTHMAIPLWKRCAGTLLEVLQTLADNQYIEVDEAYDNPEERTEEPPAGQPVKVGSLAACIQHSKLHVRFCMGARVEVSCYCTHNLAACFFSSHKTSSDNTNRLGQAHMFDAMNPCQDWKRCLDKQCLASRNSHCKAG